MDSNKTFYISTPIYYVNARPHIGHIYTTIITDVVARYHRLCGNDVYFLTGTDEHGKKVADAAAQQGVSPQQFVDEITDQYVEIFSRLGITNNDFIRTTQPRHETRVQKYVQQLLDQDEVYLGEYEGWYDVGQEEYVTETNARQHNYKSAISRQPLTRIKETNYFFRLSKFQERLIEHMEQRPHFVQPEARRNEVVSRIRQGLSDVAISRTSEPWGIPMPGDASHTIYVWVDALFNYRTALEAENQLNHWPANVHMVGKEILWFHAVIWPALLMALDWPLPQQVYAHSFWISEGKKMSKSMGNFIDLERIKHYIETFGLDALRYFLASAGPIGATDADFAESRFIEVYNTDLANTFGNCTSRVTNMIGRYCDGKLPAADAPVEGAQHGHKYDHAAEQAVAKFCPAMEQLQLDRAADAALELVRSVDSYIEQTQPFKLAKDEQNLPQVGSILYNCAEALRIASVLLWPIIPGKVEQFWSGIGCEQYTTALAARGRGELEAWCRWGGLEPGIPIAKAQPLFPRYSL